MHELVSSDSTDSNSNSDSEDLNSSEAGENPPMSSNQSSNHQREEQTWFPSFTLGSDVRECFLRSSKATTESPGLRCNKKCQTAEQLAHHIDTDHHCYTTVSGNISGSARGACLDTAEGSLILCPFHHMFRSDHAWVAYTTKERKVGNSDRKKHIMRCLARLECQLFSKEGIPIVRFVSFHRDSCEFTISYAFVINRNLYPTLRSKKEKSILRLRRYLLYTHDHQTTQISLWQNESSPPI